ncbi:MAG TPA: ATP-binding cassette domain-containing protein [Blastocatellia bacterium]|nr:ATP-binding cassette domain-containing protein [Blastocatellia bacterium]
MLLSVEGISKHFGSRAVLKDVTFSVLEGEVLGLIGPNGAGKMTLLNVLLEYTLAEPVAGKIGVWSKTDSVSYFDDFVIAQR